MKTKTITYAVIFCASLAGALFHFAGTEGRQKFSDRVDSMAAQAATLPDPSGKPNTTTLYKTNLPMPAEISEALAHAWIEAERARRSDPEIADIVEHQVVQECTMPGRVRMEDGQCWWSDVWKKLHP